MPSRPAAEKPVHNHGSIELCGRPNLAIALQYG
jgi:hypothetical protein